MTYRPSSAVLSCSVVCIALRRHRGEWRAIVELRVYEFGRGQARSAKAV
jgi:hypothetical protein